MAVSTLDKRAWIEAARRYSKLRRRYWRSSLGGVAIFVASGVPLIAFGDQMSPPLRGLLFAFVFVSFLACWIASVVTLLALWSFRCPFCGNRFAISWSNSWPTSRCKHCALDLRAAATAND
jgi:hypothetical protein